MQGKKTIAFFVILVLLFSAFCLSAAAAQVIPGGDAVAVRLQCDGVILLGFTDDAKDNPARAGGLKRGDRIVGVGESAIHSADDLTAALNLCSDTVCVTYVRGENSRQTSVTLRQEEDGSRRLGILIKDSTAGIGTLTFLLPESGVYGCLGHGITDSDTEDLFPTAGGVIYPAKIMSVRKGAAGSPGELQGMFSGSSMGTANYNTQTGLFGTLDSETLSQRQTVETAEKREVREGAATIRCTLEDGEVQEYEIEIVRIYRIFSGTTKNMLIRVTDERLLEKTGGIVQGMSGSPIFQNGKLVGAVTHVLVNDPTSGYGIFIENMLNAAQMPMAKAS